MYILILYVTQSYSRVQYGPKYSSGNLFNQLVDAFTRQMCACVFGCSALKMGKCHSHMFQKFVQHLENSKLTWSDKKV